jgi:hypothetical protein
MALTCAGPQLGDSKYIVCRNRWRIDQRIDKALEAIWSGLMPDEVPIAATGLS